MTRRAHYELIKEWADGAEIQVLVQEGWTNTDFPSWSPDREYRIKPAPIEIVETVRFDRVTGMTFMVSERNSNTIKFTIDPDTLEVLSVELVK